MQGWRPIKSSSKPHTGRPIICPAAKIDADYAAKWSSIVKFRNIRDIMRLIHGYLLWSVQSTGDDLGLTAVRTNREIDLEQHATSLRALGQIHGSSI